MICLSSAGSLTSLHGGMISVHARDQKRVAREHGGNQTDSRDCLAAPHSTLPPMTEVNKDVLSTSADTRTGTTQTGRPTRESHADYERSPLEPAHASKSAQRPRSGRETRPRGVVAPLEEVCFQPEAGSAICVQRFDDSLNSAIRTTYRISLRSSSLLMPRYPSTRVV